MKKNNIVIIGVENERVREDLKKRGDRRGKKEEKGGINEGERLTDRQ